MLHVCLSDSTRLSITAHGFLVFLGLLLLGTTVQSQEARVDFETQIAPLLAEYCIRCHSVEDSYGDISLATRDELLSEGYIIEGDPGSSPLVELVEPDGESPPAMPKEGVPFTQEQIHLLKAWIAQGAVWPTGVVIRQKPKADKSWWAYQELAFGKPELQDSNPSEVIDTFVMEKLRSHGLRMNPQADRRTLIRRLFFDLHGLPPTPEQVTAFVNDPDPKAYEKLVDHLLASSRYGERYAQHWLDIAHYADTHGFERDQRRNSAWRYRDYVISAFNNDKPYNRFLQEQVAGDILWPEDRDAVVATGFLAAGPWDFVGHVETRSPELRRAARSLDLDDMMTQVMAASMAMTVNCARCHDHKLDPISQQEYYELQAVFAGVKREERFVSQSDVLTNQRQREEWLAERNRLLRDRSKMLGEGISLAQIVGGGDWPGTAVQDRVGEVASGRGIDVRTGKPSRERLGGLEGVVPNQFTRCEEPFIDGVFVPTGDPQAGDLVVSSSGLKVTGIPKTSLNAWDLIRNGPVNSQHSPLLSGIDFTSDGHDLLGLHANSGITFDLSAIRKHMVTRETPNESENVHGDSSVEDSAFKGQAETHPISFTGFVGYFGAEGEYRADVWIYVDGELAASFRKLRRSDGLQPINISIDPSARFLTLIATDGGNGYSHDQVGLGDPRLTLVKESPLSPEQIRQVELIDARLSEIANAIESLAPPEKFYGVVGEKTVPEVRVLSRGNPETPTGAPLAPRAPGLLSMLDPNLGAIDSDHGSRRASLARWLTSPENPLVRRVIVNRLWYWHFGRGIVETPSDFGFGGSLPTHPELLDWLANYLEQSQWSIKEVHRAILCSQTYRQASAHEENFARIDAENRWLWRQNPRRLDAEVIRDAVLAISGRINLEMGGPGYEDFEYEEAYAPIYRYVCPDEPKLWRRSIYRFVVRTTPSRFLTTLDCPDPANLTPKRLTTTTPLQSLTLFNNEFMLRQARYFAERVAQEGGPDKDAAIERAFELVFSRRPSLEELELARPLVEEHGLFVLCRSLLNSNEFLYVD